MFAFFPYLHLFSFSSLFYLLRFLTSAPVERTLASGGFVASPSFWSVDLFDIPEIDLAFAVVGRAEF
jgi:hypothetical protein